MRIKDKKSNSHAAEKSVKNLDRVVYRKLSDRAFNQVLRHKISMCTWDPKLKAVTSLRAQMEIGAIAEFEQQDRVKQLAQKPAVQQPAKQHVDSNVVFPF